MTKIISQSGINKVILFYSILFTFPFPSNSMSHKMAKARTWCIMALWRCMFCFVFLALRLKVLLCHIFAIHCRSPDFGVYCGIDGCEQDFRVFNSFFCHIKRTQRTTPTAHSRGLENFGVSIFSNCSTPATTSTVGISPPPETPHPEVVGSLVPISFSQLTF